MNKISREEFISRIDNVHSATSVRGAKYSNIQVSGSVCRGIRKSTNQSFEISLGRLYDAYCKLNMINTTTLKKYVDRRQSPAMAILKEAGLV